MNFAVITGFMLSRCKTWRLPQVAGTRMACPAPSFGNDLAGALEQAQRYTTTLDGRQLVLETPALRLTFAAAE